MEAIYHYILQSRRMQPTSSNSALPSSFVLEQQSVPNSWMKKPRKMLNQYYNDEKLCILTQGTNIQNRLIQEKKELHVFNVPKYACSINSTLISRVVKIKKSQQAYKDYGKILTYRTIKVRQILYEM